MLQKIKTTNKNIRYTARGRLLKGSKLGQKYNELLTRRITFRTTKTLSKRLEYLCNIEGITMSEAINRWLDNLPRTPMERKNDDNR